MNFINRMKVSLLRIQARQAYRALCRMQTFESVQENSAKFEAAMSEWARIDPNCPKDESLTNPFAMQQDSWWFRS